VVGTGRGSVSYTSFGADFYTYIYRAVRETLYPLNAITENTQWIIIGIGGGISLFSAMNLSRILIVEKNRQQQQNQIEELCALLRNSQNK